MPDERIGLIGVGLLGSALAERLIKAGFSVFGFDVDVARCELLTSLGGTLGQSSADVATMCRRILLSLPNSDVVAEVVDEMVSELRPGCLIIDTTTLYRQSQRSTPERWADRQADAEAARQYVDLVARTQSRKLCLVTLRIPGEREYLAALDAAVHRAVTGEQTPHQALSAATDTWQQITDRLGLDRQRAAYQRSLGLNIP